MAEDLLQNTNIGFLKTRMLPCLSQINNWPCHTGRMPRTIYRGTDACRSATLGCTAPLTVCASAFHICKAAVSFPSAGIRENLIRLAVQQSANSGTSYRLVKLTG